MDGEEVVAALKGGRFRPSWVVASQQQQQPNRPKPPFKLCFGEAQTKSKLPGMQASIITPKFYSAHQILTNEEDAEVQEIDNKMKKARETGPREKYEDPMLESQKYGWFQEKFFDPEEHKDIFHFPRRTSEMVKIQSILHNAMKAEKQFYQSQLAALSNRVK